MSVDAVLEEMLEEMRGSMFEEMLKRQCEEVLGVSRALGLESEKICSQLTVDTERRASRLHRGLQAKPSTPPCQAGSRARAIY